MVLLEKQLGQRLDDLAYPYIKQAMEADTKRFPSFSKWLCISIIGLTALVVIVTIILMFITGDISPLEWLIPSVFAESSVVLGFYSYKAKAENKIKLETRKFILEKVLGGEIVEEDFELDN